MTPTHLLVEGHRLCVETESGLRGVRLCGLNRSGLQHKPSLAEAGLQAVEEEWAGWRETWAAQIVRLPLAFDLLLDVPSYATDIARVVDAAEQAGLYIVLELHGRAGALELPLPPRAAALAFWQRIAAEHGSRPHVLFDLWNEPHDIAWETWRTLAQDLIDAVRAAGAERTLVLVGGLDWAFDLSPLEDPLQRLDGGGGPLAYATHVYPWKAPRASLRAHCERAFGRVARELPVVVTEFGVSPSRGWLASWRARRWLRACLSYLDEQNLSALAWSAGDRPHLALGRNGDGVLLPKNPPDFTRPTEPFGRIVQEWLQATGASG